MMRQKIIKIRSSLAVVFPPDVVAALKLERGDPVGVEVKDGVIVVVPGVRYFEDGKVTKRFKRLARDIMKRREAVFRKLAD